MMLLPKHPSAARPQALPLRLASLLCVALLSCWLAAPAAAARLEVVPDSDTALVQGFAAYEAGDRTRARQLYSHAAGRGQRVAQFNLAVMLIGGEGGPADPVAGLEWLRKSAGGGFARAQYALGLLYESGDGVARSLADATAWFRKAAEQGYRDAQVSLATQYFLGRGAARDYAEAARWYERAAEQGDTGAAYIVASCYEHGHGVEADALRAFYWYSIAAAAGDPVAQIKAREVRAKLSR
jgi:TPR repeat protein